MMRIYRPSARSIRTLTEIGIAHAAVTTPIAWQDSGSNVLMQRGERPGRGRRHEPMLDRIEMDVIGASFEITVVANGVLPETLLP